ncbi:unnamed protein product [Echinostoma caproni]|uniref:BTB domain-containing protein n=1 Tax=Echinostoma caproni TaxID=27848 RepID=A0A183AR85_9TREM|nr:unnamed protein product [Echinostoma caproni]
MRVVKKHTADEDMQTAVALSLSVVEEDRQRKLEAKLGEKLHPSDAEVPKRFKKSNALIMRRLRRKYWSSPHLWNLASHSSTKEHSSPGKDQQDSSLFYVRALVPPISPTKSRWGSNLLSLSQIPGRSATKDKHQTARAEDECVVDELYTKADEIQYPTNTPEAYASVPCPRSSALQITSRFHSLVGRSICADSWLILDTGDLIPVHRFVFAAWDILDTVFPDHLDTSFAPGVSREELTELLHCLYAGDEDQMLTNTKTWTAATWSLARRWGILLPHMNSSSSPSSNPAINTPLKQACPELPTGSTNVFRGKKESSPTGAVCTAVVYSKPESHSPKTQLITPGSDPNEKILSSVTLSPQFSRDLFSPEDGSFSLNNISSVQEQEVEAPDAPTTSACALIQPDPLFEDQPTPCPLFKRLRLSEETSGTGTEVPDRGGSVTSSSSPARFNNESLVFTPMCIFPDQKPISGTPQTDCAIVMDCQTPITPLPNYIEMMTPELKVCDDFSHSYFLVIECYISISLM